MMNKKSGHQVSLRGDRKVDEAIQKMNQEWIASWLTPSRNDAFIAVVILIE